jgi:hypothetical protein
LLTLVKSLSPKQKERLRQELQKETSFRDENDEFLKILLNGPVYSKEEINQIEANRKSITEWRSEN